MSVFKICDGCSDPKEDPALECTPEDCKKNNPPRLETKVPEVRHTVYRLIPVNCRMEPTKFWQVVEEQEDLRIDDVIKIVKEGEEPQRNTLGYKVKNIEPLDLDPLIIMADGTLMDLPKEKPAVVQETCEGCRSLKYNGIPKWVCKKKKMGTDIQQQQGDGFSGYPIRGNCNDYRK